MHRADLAFILFFLLSIFPFLFFFFFLVSPHVVAGPPTVIASILGYTPVCQCERTKATSRGTGREGWRGIFFFCLAPFSSELETLTQVLRDPRDCSRAPTAVGQLGPAKTAALVRSYSLFLILGGDTRQTRESHEKPGFLKYGIRVRATRTDEGGAQKRRT